MKNKRAYTKEKLINEAFKYHSKGELKEAIQKYKLFIKKEFTDERVFNNYGVILMNQNKLTEAEKLFRNSILIDPNFFSPNSNLGVTLKRMGRFKEAENYLLKALSIKPNDVDSLFVLSEILINQGKFKEGKIYAQKTILERPWSIIGSYNLNRVFKKY